MIIRVERLTKELIDECEPILEANHKETGHFIEDLDVYWDAYLALGDAFVPIIMRNKDGQIRGILFFAVSLYSHISHLVMAQQVTFYIYKDSRFSAVKMLKFSESFLKDAGANFIVQSARYGTPFCDTLKRMGYDPSDIEHIKRIG